MRIGVSSYWFNRGQAVVGRHLRSALDQLGHETFVLARPSKDTAAKPGLIARGDVWDQPGVTEASHYLIPGKEMERWARQHELDVVFFDQNYQFDEIARLRELGVRAIGRFVWEQFAPDHAEGARRAFDTVYSLLECEQDFPAALAKARASLSDWNRVGDPAGRFEATYEIGLLENRSARGKGLEAALSWYRRPRIVSSIGSPSSRT